MRSVRRRDCATWKDIWRRELPRVLFAGSPLESSEFRAHCGQGAFEFTQHPFGFAQLVGPAHLFQAEGSFNGIPRAEVRHGTFEPVGRILQVRCVSARDRLLNFREGARTILDEQDRNLPQQLLIAPNARQRQLAI